jgi:hypothetical protein
VYKWILPSLSEVLEKSQSMVIESSTDKIQRQWRIAISAVEKILLNTLDRSIETIDADVPSGLVLTAPSPLFSQSTLAQGLQTVTFTAKQFNHLGLMPFQMPKMEMIQEVMEHESIVPLVPADPLAWEQFCLVFTSEFAIVLAIKENKFFFSFDPDVISNAWKTVGPRVMLSNPDFFAKLEELVQKYSPQAPDYRVVMQFSQMLLQGLSEENDRTIKDFPDKGNRGFDESSTNSPHVCSCPSHRQDIELLQAFAHEVRTPLTTIRTMTRLLLKRHDLPANVSKRLEIIDHECTEQIDRMELLFRAAELETSPKTKKSVRTNLTAMSLDQVLQQSIPRWQQAASRRNLTIDVILPQQLPTVVSNPNMLDRVLTGLMENFTRNLPSGSHIQVQVIPAGDQLKLQLLPNIPDSEDNNKTEIHFNTPPIRKAIGQLLMFQPETGTISLNLSATKDLFQAIGGKLIVRQRPRHGEVLTVFLPLEKIQS